MNSFQSGGKLVLKPTKSQSGGFLGTLLASIGIPLAVEAIKKMTGGAPRMGSKLKGHGAPRIGMYQPPPPFIGTWEQVRKGGGKKKKAPKKTKKSGAGLLLGKNSPFKNVPLLNILL